MAESRSSSRPAAGDRRDRNRPPPRRQPRRRRRRQQVDLVEHHQDPLALDAEARPAPRSPTRRCSSQLGCATSTTCSTRSASVASSRVDRKGATRWWGSLRMKPTVSVRTAVTPSPRRDPARARVEGREQPVLDQHLAARQAAEQRRLAGVGVADQGDGRQLADVARRRSRRSRSITASLPLELRDPAGDQPAVDLELGLADAAGPDAAGLPRQVPPAPRQARQQVAELGELDLGLGLAAARPLGEDVEDHRGPVEHLDVSRQRPLEVADLGSGQILVEHHRVDSLSPRQRSASRSTKPDPTMVAGSGAARSWICALDNDATGCVHQPLELVEVLVDVRRGVPAHTSPTRSVRSADRCRGTSSVAVVQGRSSWWRRSRTRSQAARVSSTSLAPWALDTKRGTTGLSRQQDTVGGAAPRRIASRRSRRPVLRRQSAVTGSAVMYSANTEPDPVDRHRPREPFGQGLASPFTSCSVRSSSRS